MSGEAVSRALASPNAGTRLEAEVALALRRVGIEVTGFDRRVFDPARNRLAGQVDVETGAALIEVTTSPNGKLEQVADTLRAPLVNPDGKAVVLYAPNYGRAAGQAVMRAGVHLARTPEQLVAVLRALGD